MMSQKGIVMETERRHAVVLLDNGEYVRVRVNPSEYIEVGQLYEIHQPMWIKYAAAAVFLLCIVAGTIDYFSVKAYAQVSSLAELGINRWGRVVSVSASSQEGERILNALNIKNEPAETAVEKVMKKAIENEHYDAVNKLEFNKALSLRGNKDSDFNQKIMEKIQQGYDKAIEKADAHTFSNNKDAELSTEKKNQKAEQNHVNKNDSVKSKNSAGNSKKDTIPANSGIAKGQSNQGKAYKEKEALPDESSMIIQGQDKNINNINKKQEQKPNGNNKDDNDIKKNNKNVHSPKNFN